MTEPINDTPNTKLIELKKFFIFNSKFGSTEGEVANVLTLNIVNWINWMKYIYVNDVFG